MLCLNKLEDKFSNSIQFTFAGKLVSRRLQNVLQFSDAAGNTTVFCSHICHANLFCLSSYEFPNFKGYLKKSLNQYQTCLYLFEYISLCESKYGNDILKL